jgi:cytidylate kinase
LSDPGERGSATVVAIDGPAGAGKSAVGRRVAEKLGLPFLDSGLLYRAVTWLALERGVPSTDLAALVSIASLPDLDVVGGLVLLGDRDLGEFVHQPEILWSLGTISALAPVREAINTKQRALARGGMVVAGRDIGTVVFPKTPFKFFLTASVDERVRRRAAQFEKRGEPFDTEVMTREISTRDELDSTRAVAPLRPAGDAFIIETEGMSLDGVVERVVERVREAATR